VIVVFVCFAAFGFDWLGKNDCRSVICIFALFCFSFCRVLFKPSPQVFRAESLVERFMARMHMIV